MKVKCTNCGKTVHVDKPLIGSLHTCLTDQGIAERKWALWAQTEQRRAIAQRGTPWMDLA